MPQQHRHPAARVVLAGGPKTPAPKSSAPKPPAPESPAPASTDRNRAAAAAVEAAACCYSAGGDRQVFHSFDDFDDDSHDCQQFTDDHFENGGRDFGQRSHDAQSCASDARRPPALNVRRAWRLFVALTVLLVARHRAPRRGGALRRLFRAVYPYVCRAWATLVLTALALYCGGCVRFLWRLAVGGGAAGGGAAAGAGCALLGAWIAYGTVCAVFLIWWQLGADGHLDRQSAALTRATRQRGVRHYRLRLYLSCTLVLLMLVVSVVVLNTFAGYITVKDKSKYENVSIVRRLFFDEPKLSPIAILCMIYVALSVAGSLTVYCLVCLSESLEMKYYNKHLKTIRKFDRVTMVSLLDKHTKLCRVIDESNSIFKFYVSSSFAILAPSLVFALYRLFTTIKVLSTVDLIYLISWISLASLIIFSMTLVAAEIHSETKRTAAILYDKLDFYTLCTDDKLYKVVSWFVSRIKGRSAGIQFGCFFFITYKLFFFMISMLAIYLTLLL